MSLFDDIRYGEMDWRDHTIKGKPAEQMREKLEERRASIEHQIAEELIRLAFTADAETYNRAGRGSYVKNTRPKDFANMKRATPVEDESPKALPGPTTNDSRT